MAVRNLVDGSIPSPDAIEDNITTNFNIGFQYPVQLNFRRVGKMASMSIGAISTTSQYVGPNILATFNFPEGFIPNSMSYPLRTYSFTYTNGGATKYGVSISLSWNGEAATLTYRGLGLNIGDVISIPFNTINYICD